MQDIDGRLAARERIIGILDPLFRTDTRANWLRRLAAANVPAGAVRTLPDALGSAEMKARGLVSEIPHPTAGTVPNVALPMHFGATPVVPPAAAPRLGEHSEEVLGFDAGRIAEAKAAGALGPRPG